MPPSSRRPAWHGNAFGLDLSGDFDAPGLADALSPGGGDRPVTSLQMLARGEEIPWPASYERVDERRLRDGTVAMTVDSSNEDGYRLVLEGYGEYAISPDGLQVTCAPPEMESWRWQRFLIGQVLPLAAALRGMEPIHASAVSLHNRAVAFVGPSGAGKSSVTVNLMLRGAVLLADDVLSLKSAEHGVVGWPGAAVTSVRHGEASMLGPADVARLGRTIGTDDDALRIKVARASGPLPLAAIYVLEVGAGSDETSFHPIEPPDPRLLLATTFITYLRTPRRLLAQLDLASRMADSVSLFKVRSPRSVGAAALAEEIERHMIEAL